jgi:hypothetical protein
MLINFNYHIFNVIKNYSEWNFVTIILEFRMLLKEDTFLQNLFFIQIIVIKPHNYQCYFIQPDIFLIL